MFSVRLRRAHLALGRDVHGVDEVAQRAPEADEPPHHDRVAWRDLVEQLGQLPPLIEGSGRPIGEDSVAPCPLGGRGLEASVLLQRGDPCIPEEVSHGGRPVSESPAESPVETVILGHGL